MIFQRQTFVALEVIFPVTSNRVVTSVPKKKILNRYIKNYGNESNFLPSRGRMATNNFDDLASPLKQSARVRGLKEIECKYVLYK